MTPRLLGVTLLLPMLLGAQQPSVRYGVTKSLDTVTVGEVLEVRFRIRAPADAQIRFPGNPDTTGTVQARDPRTIEVGDTLQARDETAIYRLAAWDVGRQAINLGDAVVLWQGAEHRVPAGAIDVFVRSVLPADSSLHVPKPPRPLWEPKAFPWWILAAILGAIALGLLLWWWLRRRRRPGPAVVLDPYDRAQREFNRIEAMGLVEAGERTRFVALVAEVLRDYFAARFADAPLALTSRELVNVMRRHPTVPVDQLVRLLHETDLAKFAAWAVSEDRARSLAHDARALVKHERDASQPPLPPDAQAAA